MSAIVTTRAGKLEGESLGDQFVFRGIPYAAPPVESGDGLDPRRRLPASTARSYEAKRRATMLLGAEPRVEDAPYDEERRAWEAVPHGFIGEY